MRIGFSRAATALIVAAAATACRTPSSTSALRDAQPTVDVAAATARVELIEKGCAFRGCHNATEATPARAGKLGFDFFKKLADSTQPIHQCFVDNNCYADTLTAEQAQRCDQACISGMGGWGGNAGIFHTAIPYDLEDDMVNTRQVLKPIFSAINNRDDVFGNMMVMPPARKPNAPDLGADKAKFLELASWLTAEKNTGYQEIRAVRPPAGGGGGGNADGCGEFPAAITSTFVADYVPQFSEPMFGCNEPGGPLNCLKAFPKPSAVPTIGEFADQGEATQIGATLRVLRELRGRNRSSYWSRASADGRFIAIGNGTIEDLAKPRAAFAQTGDPGRVIKIQSANIDPVFAPDNKTYGWPGMICAQDPLYTESVTTINSNDNGCMSSSIPVYSSMGTDDNGDQLMMQGSFSGNYGAFPGSDSPANGGGSFNLTRIAAANRALTETLPFQVAGEQDHLIGPSSRLINGRANANGQQYYSIRAVRNASGAIKPDESPTGKICVMGEKANFSFDNRFLVFHHFAVQGAAQDAGAAAGHANIFLYDMKAKKSLRITNVPAGSSAFFPHFRADGWIYFIFKKQDANGGLVESVVASDAALKMKAANP